LVSSAVIFSMTASRTDESEQISVDHVGVHRTHTEGKAVLGLAYAVFDRLDLRLNCILVGHDPIIASLHAEWEPRLLLQPGRFPKRL
jgi:hypothetical protein